MTQLIQILGLIVQALQVLWEIRQHLDVDAAEARRMQETLNALAAAVEALRAESATAEDATA